VTARQRTLAEPIALQGKGVHSNQDAKVVCLPAKAGTGFVFDLLTSSGTSSRVAVSPISLREGAFCTAIGTEEVEVRTVEHLLAGLLWMGVDNVRIEVEGLEIPIGDGSALPIAREIERVGLVELDADRESISIEEPIFVKDGNSFIVGWPGAGLSVECFIHFDHPSIGEQIYEWILDGSSFLEEIAPARTFGFEKDWALLKERGLALGANLGNTVVLKEDGSMANQVRFETEFVRHKVLDFLGDAAILGRRLEGRVFASRPSHRINGLFVRKLHERFG